MYFHVSDCLAGDLNNTFLFCKTQISLLWSLFVLKFLYDYIEKKKPGRASQIPEGL